MYYLVSLFFFLVLYGTALVCVYMYIHCTHTCIYMYIANISGFFLVHSAKYFTCGLVSTFCVLPVSKVTVDIPSFASSVLQGGNNYEGDYNDLLFVSQPVSQTQNVYIHVYIPCRSIKK